MLALALVLVLAVNSGDAATLLQFESPFVDSVAANSYEYFTSYVAQPGCNLTISVTPISGDPDLYVDTSDANPFPKSASCGVTCRRSMAVRTHTSASF